MRVKVLLFAEARDLVDASELELTMETGDDVSELRRKLVAEYPALENLLSRSVFAIDQNYALDETPLTENCTVACIPPVSGG